VNVVVNVLSRQSHCNYQPAVSLTGEESNV
jgi:hypothetical protein